MKGTSCPEGNDVSRRIFLLREDGFTLVEALTAALVMAIGLFAVGTAIYTQFTSLQVNRENTIATLTAQGEIESLRGRPFDEVISGTFGVADAPGLEYLHFGGGPGDGSVVVDNPDFTNDSNIKRVSVVVRWNSVNGSVLSKTITTLMTRNGINKQ